MQNEEHRATSPEPVEGIIYRIPIAEIRSRAAVRTPGYVEDLFAAGQPDPDGEHWLIPLAALREVWSRHSAPGLDLEGPGHRQPGEGGCAGCGD